MKIRETVSYIFGNFVHFGKKGCKANDDNGGKLFSVTSQFPFQTRQQLGYKNAKGCIERKVKEEWKRKNSAQQQRRHITKTFENSYIIPV